MDALFQVDGNPHLGTSRMKKAAAHLSVSSGLLAGRLVKK